MNISIIIPVYNALGRLRHCLDSILSQDFDDFELLIVDDGSNDGSGEICDEYAALDTRIKVFHKTNSGVSSARNLGLEHARGEYVMFVDSDDALLPGALRSMSEAVGDSDFLLAGHVVCSEVEHRSGMSPAGRDRACEESGDCGDIRDVILPDLGKSYSRMQDFWTDNLKRNCPMLDAPWGKLFKRRLIGGARFCENLSYAEDKLFVFGYLAGYTDSLCATATVLKLPVYEYFVHSGSLGSDISSDKHLAQLETFLPLYADVLSRLVNACPGCESVAGLYHGDLVGRYVCRILNIFATRKTKMLTEEYLRYLYTMMDRDNRLGIFSLRFGQIFNIMLYKLGNVSFSVKVYRIMSRIVTGSSSGGRG